MSEREEPGADEKFHSEETANELLQIKTEADQATAPEPSAPDAARADQHAVLLGGKDLEMYRLEQQVRRKSKDTEIIDRNLTWEGAGGAGIGAYEQDIARLLAEGKVPLAVELPGADQVPGVVDIDHHNEKTDRDASITQVLNHLGIEPSLIDTLVAANDSGYIGGMRRVIDEKYRPIYEPKWGTELFEHRKELIIDLIRAKDRQIQGVTPEWEQEAPGAIENAEMRPNDLMVVRLNGGRPSVVQDRLYSTWEDGKSNLIVVCNSDKEEKEVWFFGSGDVCKQAVDHFKAIKAERVLANPAEPPTRGPYHAWGGGQGFGKQGEMGQCGIVVTDPEEAISYIESLEAQESKS